MLIGAVEVPGLVAGLVSWSGPFWRVFGGRNSGLGFLGFADIGLFVLCWVASFAVYRLRDYDRL